MATNAQNVSAAKPKIGGAIYAAKIGTTLPTTIDEDLAAAFKSLGYISADGLTNSTNIESTKEKAWGGDTVLVIQTSKDDSFKFKLMETLNTDVIAAVYGSDNVDGTLLTGIDINVSNADVEEMSWVVDMVLRDNTKKRVVIPAAKISAIEDIVYSDNASIGYSITIDCTPDTNGNTHYEYIKKAQVSG